MTDQSKIYRKGLNRKMWEAWDKAMLEELMKPGKPKRP